VGGEGAPVGLRDSYAAGGEGQAPVTGDDPVNEREEHEEEH
jgi:hypothetical protein